MATLNYTYPVTGATAPTAAEMFGKSAVNVEVTTTLYDESIVITHNMALTAAQLAAEWPDVSFEFTALAAATARPVVSARAANSITVTGLTPAAGTAIVKIKRPTSLVK